MARGFLAILPLALLLAACGDGGSDEDRQLNAAAAATDINASTNVTEPGQ
ncbi:hypothetical protein [Sphingomonas sp.]|nr:hypothetical protein [Sphingomonas sp.]MBO9713157.1 hypothetical protein [Sphingomonas sp.]